MSGVLAVISNGGQVGAVASSLPDGDGVDQGIVSWALNNDGTYSISTGLTGSWVAPATAAIAALYEVRVDVTSGAFSTGTTGSYLDLSTSRTWTRADPPSPPATTVVIFNVSIREKATGIVRLSQTGVVLEATAT